MSRNSRFGVFFALLATVIGLVVFTAMAWLRTNPATIDFRDGHQSGQPIHITLQTVGAVGIGVHTNWVSYMTKAPNGVWVHTTLWTLPAHTKIDMTIEQYDSGSPLRNPEIGAIYGVDGQAAEINGKSVSLVDSTLGNGVGHTFSSPVLGINVPLPGVDPNAKSFCSVPAPCPLSAEHNTITFSFTTPGAGQYPWQCFVPCGLGYLYGNGGPMQTIGYMDGFFKVVN